MRKRETSLIPLDRDAWIPSAILALLAALCFIFGYDGLALAFVVPLIIVLFFFRDPPRRIPRVSGAVVSPADGKICAIRTGPDGGSSIMIFLSVFNVHINRAPYAGHVEAIRYKPGEFLNALNPAASDRNESNWVHMRCGKYTIVVRQIAGVIARRIVCRIREGQRLHRGQRFGLIRFGSRTELCLPPEARIQVKVGQTVKGGLTILAHLPEEE